MSLRAVFFDIDDTLYSSTDFAWRARERAVEAMQSRGLRADKDHVLAELGAVVNEFGSNDGDHYGRLLKRLPPEALADTNPALLVTAGVMAYHETKWRELRLREEGRFLLEDLASTSLRLGIITAGITSKQMEKVLRLGLDQWMDPALILITDQVGVDKSNPLLYEMAAAKAGVEPSQALHVGDHPLNDIDSAKRAGFRAVLHQGSGRYAALEGLLEADARIRNLDELRGILGDWGVDLPASARESGA